MKIIFGQNSSTKNYYIDLKVGWNDETQLVNQSKVAEAILRDGKLKQIFKFDSKQIESMHQSLSDNRTVKIKVNDYPLFYLVFNTVFKKHQFMELMWPQSQLPDQRPFTVSLVTYNQARQENDVFLKNPGSIFGAAFSYDMVIVCCQEVPRNLKSQRMAEIEKYLNERGFVNIETSFNGMWEMFLLVFVKAEH